MKTDKEWEARALEMAIPVSTSGVWGIHHTEPWMGVSGALQLGREMADEARSDQMERDGQRFAVELARAITTAADERAEEIARLFETPGHGVYRRLSDCSVWAACVARSTITKPKTRERVLEEALREVHKDTMILGLDDTRRRIDRALEWKPE